MNTTTNTVKAECDTCGEEHPVRPTGKSFSGRHKVNGDYCNGRPVTPEAKPAPGKRVKEETTTERAACPPCGRKDIALKAGKLAIHKDFKLNARCVGSLKDPKTLKATAQKAPARPKPEKAKAPSRPKVALTPEGKAMAKAAAFGLSIKEHGWRTEYEINKTDTHPLTGESIASVTAVAKRGSRDDVEEMRITWWGAACIGGEDRITWSHKGRTIAVRNAKACKDRAAISHDVLTAESNRILSRKAASTGNGKGLKALPFDPQTVSDEELIERLAGRALTWNRKLDGAREKAVVKPNTKVRITRPKSNPDDRTVTVYTTEGQKSFRLSGLVSIG